MSSRVVLVLVVIAFGVMMFGRRLRFPLAELSTLLTMTIMLWLGLAEGRTVLVVVAVLLPLPLFGLRLPMISDGGTRRDDEAPQLGEIAPRVGEPARYVRGLLASRWPRGELRLRENTLSFVTEDDDQLFRVALSEIKDLRLSSSGRAQLTLRTEAGERHGIAFGHDPLAQSDMREARVFWRETIQMRRDREF